MARSVTGRAVRRGRPPPSCARPTLHMRHLCRHGSEPNAPASPAPAALRGVRGVVRAGGARTGSVPSRSGRTPRARTPGSPPELGTTPHPGLRASRRVSGHDRPARLGHTRREVDRRRSTSPALAIRGRRRQSSVIVRSANPRRCVQRTAEVGRVRARQRPGSRRPGWRSSIGVWCRFPVDGTT